MENALLAFAALKKLQDDRDANRMNNAQMSGQVDHGGVISNIPGASQVRAPDPLSNAEGTAMLQQAQDYMARAGQYRDMGRQGMDDTTAQYNQAMQNMPIGGNTKTQDAIMVGTRLLAGLFGARDRYVNNGAEAFQKRIDEQNQQKFAIAQSLANMNLNKGFTTAQTYGQDAKSYEARADDLTRAGNTYNTTVLKENQKNDRATRAQNVKINLANVKAYLDIEKTALPILLKEKLKSAETEAYDNEIIAAEGDPELILSAQRRHPEVYKAYNLALKYKAQEETEKALLPPKLREYAQKLRIGETTIAKNLATAEKSKADTAKSWKSLDEMDAKIANYSSQVRHRDNQDAVNATKVIGGVLESQKRVLFDIEKKEAASVKELDLYVSGAKTPEAKAELQGKLAAAKQRLGDARAKRMEIEALQSTNVAPLGGPPPKGDAGQNPAIRPSDLPEFKAGAKCKEGVDCSTFTQRFGKQNLGVKVPRTATEQWEAGAPVASGDLRPGDYVFFKYPTARKSRQSLPVTHVGIYLGNGEYAHAGGGALGPNGDSPSNYTYKINRLNKEKYYVGARRFK